MKRNKETKKYKLISPFNNVYFYKIIFIFLAFLFVLNTAFALEVTGTPKVEENKVSILVKKAILEEQKIKYKVYKLDSAGKRSSTNSVLSGEQNLIIADSPLTPTTYNVSIDGVGQLVRNSLYQVEFEIRESALSQKTTTTLTTFKTVTTDSRTVNPGSGSGKCSVDKANFYPNGETNNGFFKESNKPTISIIIKTIECAGQELKLTVKELDRCPGSIIPGMNCNDALSDSNLENRPVKITSTESATLNFLAGEENCETLGVYDGYDCLYYFELVTPDGEKWSSMDREGGRLLYECDGVCDTDWEQKGTQEDAVNPEIIQSRIANDEYTLLAPIGNITSIDSETKLGDYLNLIVKIFLGICGALAVIMIVIYGIQWMGTESVFGKTEAKQNITGALMGLILALASWMLLNTINPDLLGGELNIGQATIEVEGDAMNANDELPPIGTAIARCPEGIYQIQTSGGSFPVCKTMQENLKKMIDLAWSQNMNITGFGFRSKARQEQLRAQNCGGTANIYKVNAKCNPDTAIPGTSMHESGLAFDFRCDGLKIATKDNKCYLWLKSNAGKYNLKNLASEPWHWSTTGH